MLAQLARRLQERQEHGGGGDGNEGGGGGGGPPIIINENCNVCEHNYSYQVLAYSP